MGEVTAKGYRSKQLLDYREEIRGEYQKINADWDLSPTSFDGHQININAEVFANLDEQVALAYAACDPDTASGQALLNLCTLSGIERREATPSTCEVTFIGEYGVLIPQHYTVRSSVDGTNWLTNESLTIGDNATVGVTCETKGVVQASVGDLSLLSAAISGLKGVRNDKAASLGQDAESFDALRTRRNDSVAKVGSNQIDNIHAEILNLEGVKHVKIFENENDVADEHGIAPHSMMIIVDGGVDQDIARAIARKKNPGCGLNRLNDNLKNRNIVATTTPANAPFTATYFLAELVPVHVIVNLVKTKDLPMDFAERVKESILNYASGSIFENDVVTGFDRTGYDIGEDVNALDFVVPVAKVAGEDAHVVGLSINGSNTVTIKFNELASFSKDTIEVVIS